MSGKDVPRPNGEVVIYQAEDGGSRIRVLLEGETAWLTQQRMAELFQTTKQNIGQHLKNIFSEGELLEDSVIKKFFTTAADGKEYKTSFYNLDAIISVGYRIKSGVATRFRQWATARLREYIVKGFTLDDKRLKDGSGLVDYFDELLARIREIRASEARVYQRIREIFALACDYREGEEETQVFFASMQNKMHYAATGMTAAEIVRRRADAGKANMGLTSWKGGRVLKRDVGTAKNYLDAKEIDTLNRITVMFLDQAEFRAQRRQDIRMSDWEAFLDKFLRDTELHVLIGPGTVSREAAIEWAEGQYDAFAERRRLAAEAQAEARYVEDLRASAKILETRRRELPAKKNKPSKSRKKDGGEDPGKGDKA